MAPFDAISVTTRGSFRTCRRRWLWDIERRYAPKSIPTALWFGSAVHSALEEYYRNGRTPDDLVRGYRAGVEAQIEDLVGTQGFCREAVLADVEANFGRGMEIISDYAAYDAEVTQPPWEVVAVEERLTVPVHPDLPALTGRIDLLARIDGALWIVDAKTYAQRPNQKAVDADDQLTVYCWLVKHVYGEYPRGVLLNVLIKRRPSVVIRGKHLGPGQWQANFARIYSYRSQEAIDRVPGRVATEMREMLGVREQPERAYPSPGWQCASCQYFGPCVSDMTGAVDADEEPVMEAV